ncbi:MAG: SurA N-terminal domain-containing protein [Marinicellaceae bacterium]
MLRDIKQKSNGLGAKIVMGILIIAFAFWGVSGSLLSPNIDSAATVNGEKISVAKFNQAAQAQRNRMTSQFGDNIGSEFFESENFKRSVMNQIIDVELLKQTAEKFDYDVSPETIKNYIEQSEGLQIDGKFSKEAYANYLAQVGKSAELLQREIKQEIKGSALPIMVNQTAFSLNLEIENQYKLSKQTRSFEYLQLSIADYLDTIEVTEEEINNHFKEFGNDYMTEEQVAVNYIELSNDILMTTIDISDDDIQEFYDIKKENLATPEKRLTQHILLPVNGDEETVKVEIDKVAERLNAGEDFAALAKEVSQDPGSANTGGDLGWVAPGDMVDAFDEKLFSMSEGEISEPVLSSFGYHIIKLSEIKEPAIPPLEEIKDSLIEEIKDERANDRFLQVASQLDESIVDADNVLELAAETSGLTMQATELFANGRGLGIAANPEFSSVAFSDLIKLDNEISEMIDLGDNHIAYIQIKEHILPVTKPLEEVSESIKNKIKSEKAIDIIREEANKYVELINSGEKSMQEIATELEKTVAIADNIERVGSDQPFNLVSNVFKLKLNEENNDVTFVESNNSDLALVKLNAVSVADVSSLSEEEKNNIASQIERTVSSYEIMNITSELRNNASININEKVFEEAQL